MFVILNTSGVQEVWKGSSKVDIIEQTSTSSIMKVGVDAMMSIFQQTLRELLPMLSIHLEMISQNIQDMTVQMKESMEM